MRFFDAIYYAPPNGQIAARQPPFGEGDEGPARTPQWPEREPSAGAAKNRFNDLICDQQGHRNGRRFSASSRGK